MDNAQDAVAYIKANLDNSDLNDRANAFLCNRIDMVIHLIMFDSNKNAFKKELHQLVNKLRTKWFTVITSHYITVKDKIVMISEMITPELYIHFKGQNKDG